MIGRVKGNKEASGYHKHQPTKRKNPAEATSKCN